MSPSATEIMTAADIHVGAARPRCGASSDGGRGLTLARLLLRSARELCVLLLALPMSACIIPVGPDFRDPDGVANTPPFIISASPIEGTSTPTALFEITPSDVNVRDTLFLRWVIDYPPVEGGTRIAQSDVVQPSQDGSQLTQRKSWTFSCFNVRTPAPHRVGVFVSDREFLDEQTNPGAVEDDAHPTFVSWTWEQNCLLDQQQ